MTKLYLLLIPFTLLANDDIPTIEVTAKKASPIGVTKSLPSSVSISKEEMEIKQYKSVYEALRDIPGVDVVSSNASQTTSILIRGSKSEQTLVYVDGVELNDPTDPGRGADLTFLDLSNVERIEVVRGAQSVLFPGVGGVINITTRSGQFQKNETTLSVEGGSFGSVNGNVETRGTQKDSVYYSFSASGNRTDGISASATGSEKDGSTKVSFSGKVGKLLPSNTQIEWITRYFDATQDLDMVPVDTPHYQTTQQNLLMRLQGKTKLGIWEPTLGFSLRTLDRKSLDYGSVPNTRFLSRGGIYKADWINRVQMTDTQLLTAGLEHQYEKAATESDFGTGKKETDNHASTSSVYVQHDYMQEEGLYTTAGVRADYHSGFYFQHIERFSPGYRFAKTGTTIRTSVGTGFKSPSLYQLYGEFGNSGLSPEKSFSWDLGVEQEIIRKRFTVLVTIFRNDLQDLIDYDFPSNKYVNVARSRSQGVEASLSIVLVDNLKLESQYTYTEAKDRDTEAPLLRRPQHKVKNTLVFNASNFDIVLNHLMVGERTDIDPATFSKVQMPTYHLFNLAASYKLLENTKLFGRVDNLLDTRYQAVNGYGSSGISFYLGIKQIL